MKTTHTTHLIIAIVAGNGVDAQSVDVDLVRRWGVTAILFAIAYTIRRALQATAD